MLTALQQLASAATRDVHCPPFVSDTALLDDYFRTVLAPQLEQHAAGGHSSFDLPVFRWSYIRHQPLEFPVSTPDKICSVHSIDVAHSHPWVQALHAWFHHQDKVEDRTVFNHNVSEDVRDRYRRSKSAQVQHIFDSVARAFATFDPSLHLAPLVLHELTARSSCTTSCVLRISWAPTDAPDAALLADAEARVDQCRRQLRAAEHRLADLLRAPAAKKHKSSSV